MLNGLTLELCTRHAFIHNTSTLVAVVQQNQQTQYQTNTSHTNLLQRHHGHEQPMFSQLAESVAGATCKSKHNSWNNHPNMRFSVNKSQSIKAIENWILQKRNNKTTNNENALIRPIHLICSASSALATAAQVKRTRTRLRAQTLERALANTAFNQDVPCKI